MSDRFEFWIHIWLSAYLRLQVCFNHLSPTWRLKQRGFIILQSWRPVVPSRFYCVPVRVLAGLCSFRRLATSHFSVFSSGKGCHTHSLACGPFQLQGQQGRVKLFCCTTPALPRLPSLPFLLTLGLPASSPQFEVRWSTTLVPFATGIPSCHLIEKIHWLLGWKHRHPWGNFDLPSRKPMASYSIPLSLDGCLLQSLDTP